MKVLESGTIATIELDLAEIGLLINGVRGQIEYLEECLNGADEEPRQDGTYTWDLQDILDLKRDQELLTEMYERFESLYEIARKKIEND